VHVRFSGYCGKHHHVKWNFLPVMKANHYHIHKNLILDAIVSHLNPLCTIAWHLTQGSAFTGVRNGDWRTGVRFCSLKCPEWPWGPSCFVTNGYRGPFWNKSGRSLKMIPNLRLLPKLSNVCNCISTYPYTFMLWCLIKQRDSLGFNTNVIRPFWTRSPNLHLRHTTYFRRLLLLENGIANLLRNVSKRLLVETI
jgi:hypothetical protein